MDLNMTPMWDSLSDNPLAGPLVVDPIEAINEAGGFYEPNRPPRDWLKETPIPGVYITPNEVVDPRDCERWPNSPYCNGWETFSPRDRKAPISADLKPTASKCEVCVEFYPRVFGVAMTPSVVCARNDTPECQVSPPIGKKPTYEPPEIGDDSPYQGLPVAPDGFTRVLLTSNIQTVAKTAQYVNLDDYNEHDDLSALRNFLYNSHGLRFNGSSWQNTTSTTQNPPNLEEYRLTESSDYYSVNEPVYITNNAIKPLREPGTLRTEFLFRGWEHPESNYVILGMPQITNNTQNAAITATPYVYRYRSGNITIYAQKASGDIVAETKVINDNLGYPLNMEVKHFNYTFAFWADLSCLLGITGITEQIDVYLEQIELLTQQYFSSMFGNLADYRVDITPSTFLFPGTAFGLHALDSTCGFKKPPTNQPLPDNDMNCCEETLELLEAIYSRLGVDEFPVSAPPLLTQENDKEVALENHAQLWEWLARNLDAVMGQFPIKIKITDSDPTKRGNQEVELDLPNVAETLAELFGLVYQAENNSDLMTEMMLRLIPEVLATKNAAITGQSYSKANASFLGYKGNVKEVKVDYNFDLEKTDTLPSFLSNSKKKVKVFQDESKESVLDILAKLEFAAGIIKAVFYTKPTERNRLLTAIESIIEDEAQAIPHKEQWRDWLQRMNRDAGKHNAGQPIQPEIVEDKHEGFDKL